MTKDSECQILILREKHGDQYFLAKGDHDLRLLALAIVKDRLENDYYYDGFEGETPTNPLTHQYIFDEEIPDIKDLQGYPEFWFASHKAKSRAEAIVKSKDFIAAWEFLKLRRDGEYEDFDIITPEEIDEKKCFASTQIKSKRKRSRT